MVLKNQLSSDSFFGEQFEQEGVLDASVYDVGFVNAGPESVETAGDLG
jgi:hypothetical protein